VKKTQRSRSLPTPASLQEAVLSRQRSRTFDSSSLDAHRRPLVEISCEWLPPALRRRGMPLIRLDLAEKRRVNVIVERSSRTTVSIDTRLLKFALLLGLVSTATGLNLAPRVTTPSRAAPPIAVRPVRLATTTVVPPSLKFKWRPAKAQGGAAFNPPPLPTYPAPVNEVSKLRSLTHYLGGEENAAICEAVDYAARAHDGQRRKSGDPYIIHPLEVACVLAELRLDSDTIIAGLLHDVVEDTSKSLADIREAFGAHVASIVAGVTDDDDRPDIENQRQLLLAISADFRVALVKLADRVHNLRTLGAMPKEKQVKKAKETLRLFVPLARQLGVYQLEDELLRLSLAHVQPFKAVPPGAAGGLLEALPGSGALLENWHRLECPGEQLEALLDEDDEMRNAGIRFASHHRSRWARHCDEHYLPANTASGEAGALPIASTSVAAALAAPVVFAAPAVAHAAASFLF
jgi:hypothetical protein